MLQEKLMKLINQAEEVSIPYQQVNKCYKLQLKNQEVLDKLRFNPLSAGQ